MRRKIERPFDTAVTATMPAALDCTWRRRRRRREESYSASEISVAKLVLQEFTWPFREMVIFCIFYVRPPLQWKKYKEFPSAYQLRSIDKYSTWRHSRQEGYGPAITNKSPIFPKSPLVKQSPKNRANFCHQVHLYLSRQRWSRRPNLASSSTSPMATSTPAAASTKWGKASPLLRPSLYYNTTYVVEGSVDVIGGCVTPRTHISEEAV